MSSVNSLAFIGVSGLIFNFCFVFMKPNAAFAMVLKSGEGVGSEPVQKNVMRHVYTRLRTPSPYCLSL